ncbi:envelope stress response membrane protein PspB [Vibrio hyugaensis]|uniref:envelope stress response membrane protein PspB n=1 Tax=Vibrio TaxID=662 RepID=UPI0005EEF79F|nr:envelope stress response membrane protein PspB [Vibrio hyugaensis]
MLTVFFTGSVIVFLIFVAPLWLLLHYRSKRRVDSALSEQDLERLQVLSEKAEAMQSRVETLERILDAESPTWRRKYE